MKVVTTRFKRRVITRVASVQSFQFTAQEHTDLVSALARTLRSARGDGDTEYAGRIELLHEAMSKWVPKY